MNAIIWLSIIGVLVSCYLTYADYKMRKNPKYKPICDISDAVSCSKNVKSGYGSIFGVSNSLLGIGYYIAVIVLFVLNLQLPLLIAVSLSLAMSVYLGYAQYFRVRSLCIVCTSVYVINALLFFLVLF